MSASPTSRGNGFIVAILAGLGCLVVLALLAIVGAGGFFAARLSSRSAATAPIAGPVAALPSSTSEGPADDSLPSVARHVPVHETSLLAGCSRRDVAMVASGIGDAIDIGAPLYNEGNFAGCYHVYEGAALDLERRLAGRCVDVAGALADGRATAARRATPSDQAWAMRDAFDGLIDVIDRSGELR